jgi:hypothetical protein
MHAHAERLVSVVKMGTVLETCTTKEQHSAVQFLWANRLTAKDIHKEMFPLYYVKCLSHKAVYIWVEKFYQ